MSEMSDWIAQMQTSGMMTRPGGEGPFPAPAPAPAPEPPPSVYRPPPEVTPEPEPIAYKPPVVAPPAAPAPVAPGPSLPGGEMGQWIEEMIRRGMITRATPEQNASVGMPDPYGLPQTKGDPAVHSLVRNPDGTVSPAPVTPPGAPAYPGAPPWAGDPNIPAPLAAFLRWQANGNNVLSDDDYRAFGGDSILEAIRKYDPNAQWEDTNLGGGEAGFTGDRGRRLNFNNGLLPQGVGPGFMRPTGPEDDRLHRPEMQYYDPNYGWVTDPRNVAHDNSGLHAWAPYIAAAISMFGPAAGAALAGAGIGAGSTAAVTGAAAGLPAGSIAAGGTPSWWTNWLSKAPRTVGPILSGAPSAPSTNPPPARPPIPKAAAMPDPYGFNPAAFNSGGSTAAPKSTDSKLVATQFADDPYRFS